MSNINSGIDQVFQETRFYDKLMMTDDSEARFKQLRIDCPTWRLGTCLTLFKPGYFDNRPSRGGGKIAPPFYLQNYYS